MNNNIISRYFILLLSLLILSSLAEHTPCNYRDNNHLVQTTDDKDYLDKATGDEAKQKCFILSKSKENQDKLCCYNKTENKCYLPESENDDLPESENDDCPKETDIVNNNCGMAYIYQPVFPGICKEISLVQGYCCYIKYKYTKNDVKNTAFACVKTKELNKNKKSATNQIKDYIKKCKEQKNETVSEIEIESVDCNQFFLKYFYNLIIFTTILLL